MSEYLHPQTNSLFPPISIWCPNNCCDLLVQLYGLNYLCYFSLFKYDVWWLPTYKTKEGHTPWTHFDNLVRRWTKVLFSLFLCNFQPSEKILHEANIIIWLSSGVFIHVILIRWTEVYYLRQGGFFLFKLWSRFYTFLSLAHTNTHTPNTQHISVVISLIIAPLFLPSRAISSTWCTRVSSSSCFFFSPYPHFFVSDGPKVPFAPWKWHKTWLYVK